MNSQGRINGPRAAAVAGAIVGCLLLIPALAFAHLERPSYWPDPRPEKVDGKKVGGEVPKAQSLGSALKAKGASELHVVCQGKKGKTSLNLLKASIKDAKKGWTLRPSQGEQKLSKKKGKKLTKTNKQLAKKCKFKSVQDAVNAADNWDRIVVMPGLYTEPKSRKAPLNDPKCNPSMLGETQSGALAPSYEYQAECPNDQNLIHVQGRAVKGDPVSPPRPDRHGIPEEELGKCINCGLQLEGSGVKPEDVIFDAGTGYEDPDDPNARPGGDTSSADCNTSDADNPCFAKHVVLRTDRTDGFVGRNFLMRGAKEHGFYTEESDGVLLDRVKFFWNADYGHLSFTSDHSVVQNCDGYGSGDAVVYPGAAPQTGEFRNEQFYPEERYNTTIKDCDLHGSAMGYSGSMGNSVRVTNNHFYGNANGLTTDTLSAPGHPGLPRGRDEDRQQLLLREQPRHLPRRQPLPRAGSAGRRDGLHVARPQQRPLRGQLGLRQLAPGHVPDLDPGRGRGRRRGRGRPRHPLPVGGARASRPPATTSTRGTTWARSRPTSSPSRS